MAANNVQITKVAGNNVTVNEENFNVQLTEESVKVVHVGSVINTGISDKNYVHEQSSPSASWEVTHNLNKRCSVTVVDSAGTVIICDVSYVSDNAVVLNFDASTSGRAYFN